jgi:hypothetical protein
MRETANLTFQVGENAVAPLGAERLNGTFEMRLIVEHPPVH